MKMMAGACLRAVWNRSRTRDGPHPDEHLHEVRSRHRQERHAGLAGDRPGQQGLPGARRPHQEDALGDLGPDLLEPVSRAEEVDHLGDLELDAVVAGHVGERGSRPLGRIHLGLRTPDRHDAAHLALGPSGQPDEQQDDDRPVQQVGDDGRPRAGRVGGELEVLDVPGVELELGGVVVELGALDGEFLSGAAGVGDVAGVLVDGGLTHLIALRAR